MYVGIAVAVVAIVVLVQLRMSLRKFLRADQQQEDSLHALARTPIKDLAVGTRVRIVGKAVGSDVIKSPYGGTPCLAFHCDSSATVRSDGGNGGSSYAKTFKAPESRDVRPFLVDDGTGQIAIEVGHVTLDLRSAFLSKDQVERHAFGAKILAREATSTTYHEAILVPDEQVGVIGTVQQADDGTLLIVGTPDAPLVVSNRSGALV